MKALLFEEIGKPMVVKEVADPELTPDGVIIKVMANGICRSDWHEWLGHSPIDTPYPRVLGHEFSGIVEEVGANVKSVKKGDRVIVPVSQSDGTCPYCRRGDQNLCDNLTVPGRNYWGGYAEYVHIPKADGNLIHLPESFDFVSAASLGCRFVTAYHGLIDRVNVQPGEWVAVHGCGGVGISAVQLASAMGAKVIAIDIGDDKLEVAKQLGATVTVNSKTNDPIEAVLEVTKGGADVAVDALGIVDTCQKAILGLGKRGRHLQIGLNSEGNIPLPVNYIAGMEIEMYGSGGMPSSRYPAMFNLIETLNIDISKLISQRVSLEEAFPIIEAMGQYSNVAGMSVVDFS